MEKLEKIIEKEFNNRAKIVKRRADIYQLYIPIFHEDGDMIDIFISPKGEDRFTISDYGQTLMRLSYSYDIDSENKEAILKKIVSESKMEEKDGNIMLVSDVESLFNNIMQAAQTYAKVGSMKYFKREVIESLFYGT